MIPAKKNFGDTPLCFYKTNLIYMLQKLFLYMERNTCYLSSFLVNICLLFVNPTYN